jgi:hypothetical protein
MLLDPAQDWAPAAASPGETAAGVVCIRCLLGTELSWIAMACDWLSDSDVESDTDVDVDCAAADEIAVVAIQIMTNNRFIDAAFRVDQQ